MTLCIHLIRRKKTLKAHILQVLGYGPIFQLLSKFIYPPRVKRVSRDYREISADARKRRIHGTMSEPVDILRPASRMRLQSHGTPGSSVRSSLATSSGRFCLSLLSIVPGDFPGSVSLSSFLSFLFSPPLTSSFSSARRASLIFKFADAFLRRFAPEFPGERGRISGSRGKTMILREKKISREAIDARFGRICLEGNERK